MNNNNNSLMSLNGLINSYYEYLELIKKYKDKYKDKNTRNNSNIDIKSLILDYLNFKYENGEKWIQFLIPTIKRQHFLSQHILLSIFYIDICDLIIKPKCFNNMIAEKIYPQSEIFTYKIIKNDDIEDENKNADIDTIKYKIKRQESYELFEVIKKQIEYKENPFNITINNFINCFSNVVQNKLYYLEKIKNNKEFNTICGKIFEELKQQINEFTILLTKCITLLYKLNNIQEYDTYYALLISIIFNGKGNSKKLYELLMSIIEKKEKNKIENFKKIISKYSHLNKLKPEDFSVEDKFCLNEKSKMLYENTYKTDFKNSNEINESIPYENSINIYKKIKEYQNPFDKLLLTVKLSKIIAEDINQFWSHINEDDLKNQKIKLNIEADDFISIFKYIIIKGGIEDIYSHIFFIESFTSNQIKSESEWYYLSLIQVSLMQLEEIKEI